MKNRDKNKQEITTWRKQIPKLKANKQNKSKKKKDYNYNSLSGKSSTSIKQKRETIKETFRQFKKNKKLEILNIYDNISGKLNE